MARSRALGEIFTDVKRRIKNADKSSILKANAGYPLYYTLWLAFSDKVEWLGPESVPEYKAHRGRPGTEPADLKRELRRLYIFFKGSGEHLNNTKRDKIFTAMLETLPPDECELLIALRNKDVDKKFKLPKKLVEETFPGLLEAPFTLKFIPR